MSRRSPELFNVPDDSTLDQAASPPPCENDPDLFFPTSYANKRRIGAAAGICSQCPIREGCLELALTLQSKSSLDGIWAGTTPKERAELLGGAAKQASFKSIAEKYFRQ